LVSKKFLRQYDPIKGDEWTEVIPGRVGGLKLQVSQGCVDMWCLYLTTGDAKEDRERQLQALYPHLRPASQTLTILGGDWNFAAEGSDRGQLDKMMITHNTCTKEHDQFMKNVDGKDLFDLQQHDFTHRSGTGLSRIDRIYCNFGAALQLDHQVYCEALGWPPSLTSAHWGQLIPRPREALRLWTTGSYGIRCGSTGRCSTLKKPRREIVKTTARRWVYGN
jgi:hypothetical protein